MRVAPHVDRAALKNVASVSRMKRLDLGVLGAFQIVEIVALDRLVQKRKTERQNQRYDDDRFNGKAASGVQARKIGSTAFACASRSRRSSSESGL